MYYNFRSLSTQLLLFVCLIMLSSKINICNCPVPCKEAVPTLPKASASIIFTTVWGSLVQSIAIDHWGRLKNILYPDLKYIMIPY